MQTTEISVGPDRFIGAKGKKKSDIVILRPVAQLLREIAQIDGVPPDILLRRLIIAEGLRRALPIDPDAVRSILLVKGEERKE